MKCTHGGDGNLLSGSRGYLTVVGELEHRVTSNISKVVPEFVQTSYVNTRDAVKGFFSKTKTDEEVATGWGVREAQEASQNEASMSNVAI